MQSPTVQPNSQGEQQRLADLHNAGMTATVTAMTVCSFGLPSLRPAVFMQLLAGLDRVQSLSHQRAPTSHRQASRQGIADHNWIVHHRGQEEATRD